MHDEILVKRNDLRFDPTTERMAQRIPDSASTAPQTEMNWISWSFPEYGLTVEYLSDDDVSGWKPLYVEE